MLERKTAWEIVQLSRHLERPSALTLVRYFCQDFFELRGDRLSGDDRQLIGGPMSLNGQTIMLIAQEKGTKDGGTIRRFSMPTPLAYRKAQRFMKHAEKFKFPVVSLIDTPGADPTLSSEEHGQAWAISECLHTMLNLRTATIAVVIGQGGSGGAIAIGAADRLLMFENTYYTVAAPEAAASILWMDTEKAAEAATALRITASDMLKFCIADEILPEPEEGAHNDPFSTSQTLREALIRHLEDLRRCYFDPKRGLWRDKLLTDREKKYREIGILEE